MAETIRAGNGSQEGAIRPIDTQGSQFTPLEIQKKRIKSD